jgi:pyruvate-ferredoxin/flavodoxin oxidoreductase
MEQQKAAVQSGYWPLFRYNPLLAREGKNPFQLDSKPPSMPLKKYAYNETRYTMLAQSNSEVAKRLLEEGQNDVNSRWRLYEHWAALPSIPSHLVVEGKARGAPTPNGSQKEDAS